MPPKATDVWQTVIYGSEKATRQRLILAAFVCAVGVAGIYTSYGFKQHLAWAIALPGAGWLAPSAGRSPAQSS